VINTRQSVRVVFLSKKDSVTVKLLEPLGPTSSVSLFARKGGGFHHVCFRCDNLETQIPILSEKGARLIVPAQPGEAFLNNKIAFLFAQNNLNFELIDTAEKAGWTDLI
jgi:methylmalonyl-CoA/ethylmalonyl-CoA epimerase